jgi:hypothetical protein
LHEKEEKPEGRKDYPHSTWPFQTHPIKKSIFPNTCTKPLFINVHAIWIIYKKRLLFLGRDEEENT